MPLPDVPQSEYDAYTAELFSERANKRISTLDDRASFLRNSSRRINSLGIEMPEAVEVSSPNASVLRGQIAPPIIPPVRLPQPQIPQPQLPQFPTPTPSPPQIPTPQPQPTPAPTPQPYPGITPTPRAPVTVAPPAPAAPQPVPAVVPQTPYVPEVPGGAAPSAEPVGILPGQGAQGVDTSAPAMAAVFGNAPGEYQNYARQAAIKAGIDPSLFMAQIQQESGYNPRAGSPAGAQGIAQIVPKYHPGVDPSDPYASLDYAANLMSRLLKQYGGDWEHALVAYNGGGGAVARWDAGNPIEESQTYVARILGSGRPNQAAVAAPQPLQAAGAAVSAPPSPAAARPVATAMAQSQFGDRELTASEAYAACGPAAAVRFAQAYGRNPTLREATDLAAEVGWTQQQGMAGIASEQRLMQKLGLETRLVMGRNWDQYAKEAQTGNPVVISTPGHYFYADGFNPDTGAFHVGRSGLDLRRGKEWMTPAEMEGLMGTAQGALLSNMPTVTAPSSTIAGTPTELADVRRQISSSFATPATQVAAPRTPPPPAQPNDPQVQAIDRAVTEVYSLPRQRQEPPPEPEVRRPVPPVVMPSGMPPPGPPSGNPFDQFGQTMANALRSLFGGGGGPPPPRPPDLNDERRREQERQQQGVFEERPPTAYEPFDTGLGLSPEQLAETSDSRARQMRENLFRNPVTGEPFDIGQVTGAYTTPPRNLQEAADRAREDILRRGPPFPGPGGTAAFLPPRRSFRELNPLSKGPEGVALERALSEVPGVLGGVAHAGEEVSPIRRVAGEAIEAARRIGRPIEVRPGIVGAVGEFRQGVPRVNADRAEYMAAQGLENPARIYAENDVPLQQRIAEYYERTPSTPDDPEVRAAYDAFNRESHDQYQHLVDRGMVFEPYGDDVPNPYPSSDAMRRDVADNNHLWVYTGGEPHPMMTPQQNWEFRAVHDYFGHANSGVAFGPRGEENAWLEHMGMYSPQARRAMTTETRGQNSWVNFGPYGEQNRADPTKTVFAEQKALLLPDEFMSPSRTQIGGELTAPHGMAVPRPGYERDTPEYIAEQALRRAAQEQGTATPNLTKQQIQSLPGMENASISDLNEAREMIRRGLDGMRWYQDMVAQIARDTGQTINPREAAVLMGRFGGNAGVQANYHAMLSVFDALRQVKPDLTGFEDLTDAQIIKTPQFRDVLARVRADSAYAKDEDLASVLRAYRTGIVEIPSGAKLSSYTQSFLHALSDSYQPYSTQDVWQARLFGSRPVQGMVRAGPPRGAKAAEKATAEYEAAVQKLEEARPLMNSTRAADRDKWVKAQRAVDQLGLKMRVGIRGPEVSASDPAYRSMHALTNWLARELNINPHEAQAAGWVVARTLMESPEYGPALTSGRMPFRAALALEDRRGGTLLQNLGDTIGEITRPTNVTEWDAKIRALRQRIQSNGSFDAPPHPSWTAAGDMSLRFPADPRASVGMRVGDIPRPVGGAEAQPLIGLAREDAPMLRVPGQVPVDESGRIPWLAADHQVHQVGDRTYVTVTGVGDDAADLIGRRLGADSYNHASPEVPYVGGVGIEGLAADMRGAVADALRARGTQAIDTGTLVRVPLMNDMELRGLAGTIRAALNDVGAEGATLGHYTGVTHDIRGASGAAERIGYPGAAARPSDLPARPDVDRDAALAARLFRDAGTPSAAVARAPGGTAAAVRTGLGEFALGQEAQAQLGPAARLGLAAGSALGARQTTDKDDPNRGLKMAAAALGGLAVPTAARAFAQTARLGGRPPGSVLPTGAIGNRIPPPSVPPGGLRLGNDVARRIAYEATNRNVAIDQLQEAYARALGRRLRPGEQFATLRRLQPGAAAESWAEEGLGPAIRMAGDHLQSLVDLVTLRHNVSVATGLGARHGPAVATARQFSGGLDLAGSQAALRKLEADLGPQKWRTLNNAADQIFDHSREVRQRLVDADVLSPQQATDFEMAYNDWVKTHILDFTERQLGTGMGGRVGLNSNEVNAYALAGTQRSRLDPLASAVDYTYRAERMARKNEVYRALADLDDELMRQTGRRELTRVARTQAEYQAAHAAGQPILPVGYKAVAGETPIHGFRNGDPETYITRNPMVAEAINAADTNTLPGWARAPASIVRAGATARNPAFLVGNTMLDVPTYLLTTTARGGLRGLVDLPWTVYELVRSYGDTMQGLGSGRMTGAGTREFLRGGGGFSGASAFHGGPTSATDLVRRMRREGAFTVNSRGDALQLMNDVAGFGWVQSFGQRLELAPRVAAMRMAQRRGLRDGEAIIQGRRVTMDFDEAGRTAKFINQIVPFFNVGVQGPTIMARLVRDHPVGTAVAGLSMVGVPAFMAEVHNHSTPEMAKDYEDVPDYIKDTSLVWMLGSSSTDDKGNRRPNYIAVNMRAWAPFAQAAREVANRAAGREGSSWEELASQLWTAESPFGGGGLSNFASSLLPTGVQTAFQLQQNKDYFRNAAIMTNRTDENASALAQRLAEPVTRAVQQLPGQETARVRPSALDFIARDIGGGLANVPLGAGDLAAGRRRSDEPANIPVLGGFAGRVVRGQGGQRGEDARQPASMMNQQFRQKLQSVGDYYEPTPVQGTIDKVPLRSEEQAEYQIIVNRKFNENLGKALTDRVLHNERSRTKAIEWAMDRARDSARREILSRIPRNSRVLRKRYESSAY